MVIFDKNYCKNVKGPDLGIINIRDLNDWLKRIVYKYAPLKERYIWTSSLSLSLSQTIFKQLMKDQEYGEQNFTRVMKYFSVSTAFLFYCDEKKKRLCIEQKWPFSLFTWFQNNYLKAKQLSETNNKKSHILTASVNVPHISFTKKQLRSCKHEELLDIIYRPKLTV